MPSRSESRRSFFTKVMSAAAGAWVGASATWLIGCAPAAKYGGPPGPPPPPPPPPPEPAPTTTMVEPSPPPSPEPPPEPGPGPSVKYGGPTLR